MKRYFWPYVVLVVRRQRGGYSQYMVFGNGTWNVDFCGNGDSTVFYMQTLCFYHSRDKEQANNETLYYFLFTLTVNVKLYLHIKNIIPYLSFKLCFQCFMETDI